MTDTRKILDYISKMRKEIEEYDSKKLALKKEISTQKDLLYNTCTHEWYIERDDCWDSVCNKRCKHCNLWQNQSCN